MEYARAIKVTLMIVTLGFLVTFAAPNFGEAHATPEIGKGQPCGNCHTGSPPSKKNLK